MRWKRRASALSRSKERLYSYAAVAGRGLDNRLEALLEVAAKARAGEQRAHVERENLDVLEHRGDAAIVNCERESFGERGLTDARFADEDGVVLAAAQQDVDCAFDLVFASDERIDLALGGAIGEVDRVSAQRLGG